MTPMRTLSADRIGGLIWIAFGSAVVYGSWAMDRLQSLGIPPSTAPGVVPGLLGIGIIVFGLVLILRREAAAQAEMAEPAAAEAPAPAEAGPDADNFHWKRATLSWLLCIVFGGVLLGGGLPYWLLATAFLLLHLILLDEGASVPARPNATRVLTAAIIAPLFATAVTLVFQYVFLVRLP